MGLEAEGSLNELYWAVKSHDAAEVGRVLEAKDWDLWRHYGDEGSLINIAIENATKDRPEPASVLAQLLGVEYPIHDEHEKVTLCEDRDVLLGCVCDSKGLLPLMKASATGALECMKVLLHCGADVNLMAHDGLRAIDYSLDWEDGRIVLLLLEQDSLFPRKKTARWSKLKSLINGNTTLAELFDKRENAYRELCAEMLEHDISGVFETGRYHYYVDREGASALYRSGIEEKHDTWAYLLEMGFMYSSDEEKSEVDEAKEIDEERFNRALEKVFYKADGCHVMKMVSKSLLFGTRENSEGLGNRFEAMYRVLDEEEYTKVLLRVLQDVPSFEVVFDFGATNVSRMRAKECGKKIHGLTDDKRNRVYVGALESLGGNAIQDDESIFTHSDVISNLAHELAHKVMFEVFQNDGLPYRKGERIGTGENKREGEDISAEEVERGRGDEYEDIVEELLKDENLAKCDEIIKRVKEYYRKELWSKELIVRVPEMVAKYAVQSYESDELTGVERLKNQAPCLLRYYTDHVLTECNDYVKRNFASDRMTLRAITDYQRILSSYQEGQIEVDKGVVRDMIYQKHNKLKFMRVSSIPLGQSHIAAKSEKRAFFVNWTNFMRYPEMFLSGLGRREFDLLVVSWDEKEAPKFCRNPDGCTNNTCPSRKFGDFVGLVVMLLHNKHRLLMNTPTVEYVWEELSQKTREHVLEKKLNFGGRVTTVRKVIQTVENDPLIDSCAHEYFLPSDIAYLLDGEELRLSKAPAWPTDGGEEGGRIFLSHKECFIRRYLCRRHVELNSEVVERNPKRYFFVINVGMEDLLNLGIEEHLLSTWSQNTVQQSSARIYLLHADADKTKAYDVFESIIAYHRRNGTEGRLYFLKFKDKLFFLVRSSDFQAGLLKRENEGEPVESFIQLHVVKSLLKSAELSSKEPILIADNPGCGKSVYLNQLAMVIKKSFPDSWVSFVELSVKEQQRHLESLQRFHTLAEDATRIKDVLFEMVKSGDSSFEKKLFHHFSDRQNMIYALFDGLDEICPRYKEGITSFLKALGRHTRIKVVVTTRLHEKYDLEKALDAISYSLVPFSMDDQIKFLDKYWNALLKKLSHHDRILKLQSLQRGVEKFLSDETRAEDISGFVGQLKDIISMEEGSGEQADGKYTLTINFDAVIRRLIGVGDVFTEGPEQFTKTPLHVQMAGLTIYEDSFNIGRTRNLGHLYIRFFELKMRIFTGEKARTSGSAPAETLTKMGQKMATSMLENLSANSFQENKVYGFKRNDMLVAISIGLITESAGTYHFVHRSFGEFFFAKWLLRKAKKKHVTRFWLQKLFLEDWLSGVRFFLEEIQRLLSEGVLSSDHDNVLLTQDRSLLNGRALPDSDTTQGIHRCLYAHILDGQERNLLVLVDSFGEQVVRLMLDDQKSLDLGLPEESRIAQAIDDSASLYKWKILLPKKYTNVFTFSTYCLDKLTSLSTKRYIGIIRSMLGLMEKFSLSPSMNELILENGLSWMFPPHVFFDSRDDGSTSAYISEMVGFFRDHVEVFGDSLRAGFTGDSKDTLQSIGRKDFLVLSSLVDSLFHGMDLAAFLLEETSVIFSLWMKSVFFQALEVVKHIWGYLEDTLATEERKLEYLQREDYESLRANAFLLSSYNADARVMEFVWELVTPLLRGDIKSWLFESLSGDRLYPPFATVHRGFHKFLTKRIESGFLSVGEAADLLLSKDGRGHCYLLDFHQDAFPNPILSFYDFLRGPMSEHITKISPEIKCPLVRFIKWWTTNNTPEELDDELKLGVEQSYQRIISGDNFDLIRPLPEEICLLNSEMADVQVRMEYFKANFAVLYEKLSQDSRHQGREFVVRNLSSPYYDPVYPGRAVSNHPFANILQHVVRLRNSTLLRHISCLLMKFVTQDDMKRLFLQVDFLGKTVLHNSVKHDELYNTLLEVAGKILGEETLLEVKAIRDREGNLVEDIISKMEAEDAELQSFVDFLNAR